MTPAGNDPDRIPRQGPRNYNQGLVMAILLIFAGVFIFLSNLGILNIGSLWSFWPVILIASGVARLISCRDATGQIWSLLMIGAGALLLLSRLGLFTLSAKFVWPLALVGFGVLLLVRALDNQGFRLPGGIETGSPAVASENVLKEWVLFGGVKRRVASQDFQGGQLMSIFGGIEVDLRRAGISPLNKEVFIDAVSTFGGINIRVPDDWVVVVRGVGIFGGYEDKTIPPRPTPGANPPKLIVTGSAVFGGVAIEN